MTYGDSEAASYDGPEDAPTRLRRDGNRSLGERQENVEKLVARLSQLADQMEERLQAVLGPHRPTPADGSSRSPRDPDDAAPLSAWFDETAGRLASVISRIGYTLDRVEL